MEIVIDSCFVLGTKRKKKKKPSGDFNNFPSLDIEQHQRREGEGRLAAGLDNQSEPEKLTALAGGCISRGLYRAQFII